MRRVRFEILIRVFADTVVLNCALAAGFVLDYLLRPAPNPAEGANSFSIFVTEFGPGFWLLTPIALATFHAMGFYTKGRAYSGRYKVLIVAQAVTLAYLIFGFFSYFLLSSRTFPRKAFVVAWILTLVSLVAARVWAFLWKMMLSKERDTLAEVKNEVLRTVLLIGGAGYIGSALLPRLLDKGYRVRLMDMFIYGDEPIAKYLDHPHLEVVRADFRQVDKVVEAMVGMETVIHIGAIVGDPACAIDEDLTIEINLIATKMIAEVAKGQGVSKFIFASTCSVYGASDQILNENSSLNPVSLYARSKIASERVLVQMRTNQFQPVILRFGTIYGLSGRTRFDLVVNLLAAKAVVEGKITVFGSDQWRPFIHVEDAARAIVNASEADATLLTDIVFNVGSDEQNLTLGQIGDLIKSMVPTAEVISTAPDMDRRNYRVDFRRIREMLGFTPRWDLKGGIQQVLDAIGSGRVVDYRDARYSNVKYLTEEATSELWQIQNGWYHDLLKPGPAAARAAAKAGSASRPI